MPPRRAVLVQRIADTQLGLTAEELDTFRRHRGLVFGQATSSANHRDGTRSEQQQLLLDPSSLRTMASHLDRVSVSIQLRMDNVGHQQRSEHRSLLG